MTEKLKNAKLIKFFKGEFVGKKKPRVYKRIDPSKIAQALGTEHITEPREKEEFKKRYGLRPHLITKSDKHELKICCRKHPKYLAERRPKLFCPSCLLLYVLRHQHEKNGPELPGSLNPYGYFLSGVNLEAANSELKVSRTIPA